MDKMPGKFGVEWCPPCSAPSGPDCMFVSKSKRQVRQQLKRELAKEVKELGDYRES